MGKLSDYIHSITGQTPRERVPSPSLEDAQRQRERDTTNTSTAPTHPPGPPPDCFDCKVVGSVAFSVLSLYTLYSTREAYQKFEGRKRLHALGAGLTLSALFAFVAGCRAFSVGVFNPKHWTKTE